MLKILSTILIAASVTGLLFAQDTDSKQKYINGKELYAKGKYNLAKEQLRAISVDNNSPYRLYASYFYALAAYKSYDKVIAKNKLLKLKNENPKWESIDEVNLWLCKMYFEEGDFLSAFSIIDDIKNPLVKKQANELKQEYVAKLDVEELEYLYSKYRNDEIIGKTLAFSIKAQPITEQNTYLLDTLVNKFNLDRNIFTLAHNVKSIRKSRYQVAVLLPFNIDKLQTNRTKVSNEFVLELYRGIELGVAQLKKQGIYIDIYSYDTKSRASSTRKILENPELKNMDLIIGPLYPEPVQLVNDFSFENHINVLNPLSYNHEVIENNPFSFLLMPTYEKMAENMANFMAKNMANKNLMIFYSDSDKDSTLAFSYKKYIEEKGFKATFTKQIEQEESKKVIDILTNTVTLQNPPSSYHKKDLDSMAVRKSFKPKATLRIGENDYLVIQPDSLGHILLATDNANLIAAMLTAMETRHDHTTLVGKDSWILNNDILSIEAIENLSTYLMSPTFYNYEDKKIDAFYELYVEKYNTYPNTKRYAAIGYDAIVAFGTMMNKYGNHFESLLTEKDNISSTLFPGYDYYQSQCNRYLPVSKFDGNEWRLLNPLK